MKTTILLLSTLVLAQSVLAQSKELGPPIQIMADGPASVYASNILTDDCTQPPVFPEPGQPPLTPKIECDNSHPHLKGSITINGAAADELFNGMRDVKLHPGVPNILERDRNSLSWDEVPYKTGKNIFCFQFPVKKADKAVLETGCRIEVGNLNTGEIDDNQQ